MTEIESPKELVDRLSRGNVMLMNEASWCGFCQQHKPEFIRQSKMHKDTDFLIFDMDKHRGKLTGRYSQLSDAVKSYPTILAFKSTPDGVKAYRSTSGARDDTTTANMVKFIYSD
jgi:thiol-disulfide isomerase/thioredoxin